MSATIQPERVHRALRIRRDDDNEIRARATQHGLSITRYLVDSALDRLPATQTLAERLSAMEERLERLERGLFS